MSEEERRQKARGRVKAWKEKNGWLVRCQRKRRWGRIKEALGKARKGTVEPTRVTNTGTQGYLGKEVQETRYVSTDEVEGDPVVMRRHAEEVRKRIGAEVEKRVPSEVKVVETENEKRTYARLDELMGKRVPVKEKEIVFVEM